MIEPTTAQRWGEAHDNLKDSMQKEIRVMREILANMHQEEMSLVRHDTFAWNQIMQDRFSMIQKLSTFREERLLATHKLEVLAQQQLDGKKATIEQILPPHQEESCEILLLLDQILALTERMNRQQSRNETLSLRSYSAFEEKVDPILAKADNRLRKNIVTTLPPL